MQGDEQSWWADHAPDLNGVFKGGGAKGVLYAGALEAVDDSKHWFRSVAGASAGAITATLVAAGVQAKSTAQLAAEGLRQIHRNYLMDVVGQPFIRTKSLQRWLDDLLLWQVAVLGYERLRTGPVTFDELFAASGIELYVVCVNVAERQPLVFHHQLTPNISVASAVVASSSIPIAFRPGRLRVTNSGVAETHRLMDGGVWANYPMFVFRDASFRAFHGLSDLPEGTRTVGFTLDSKSPSAASIPTPLRFEPETTRSAGDRGAGLKGLLRNPALRIYFLTIAPFLLMADVAWTTSQYGLLVLKDNFRDSASPGWVQGSAGFVDGFFTHFTPALWALYAAVAAFALIMLFIGATLIDSAVPALKTLMAVGTDVPYWTGSASDDHVVRLLVPHGLTTMSFKITPEALTSYVAGAREATTPQLASILKAM